MPWAASIYSWPPRPDSCSSRLWHPCAQAPHQIRLSTGLARERLPSTASRAWGSLTPSTPPTRTPCPSQAPVGLHFLTSREKITTITISDTILTWFLSNSFFSVPHLPWGRGGNNTSAAFAGRETGDAVAETNTHPHSMFRAAACTSLTPLAQKRDHSLPPTSNRAACQVSTGSLSQISCSEASPPLKNKTWPISNSWQEEISGTQALPSSQETKNFFPNWILHAYDLQFSF